MIYKYFDNKMSISTKSSFDELEDLNINLQSSVKQSLEADTEVGLFLSGGLDSSLIAAIGNESNTRSIQSWTVDYPDNEFLGYQDSLIIKESDLPFAKNVAKALNHKHRIVSVQAQTYLDGLNGILDSNDMICGWEQEISQNLLAKSASSKVKAILVGDAADELNWGYSFLLNPSMCNTPNSFFNFFGSLKLNPLFLKNPESFFEDHYKKMAEDAGHSWKSTSDQMYATSYLINSLWLQRLLHHGDIHTMSQSLESRVPFASQALIQQSQNFKIELTLNKNIEKWHLRKIAEKWLPHEIAWRSKSAMSKGFIGRHVLKHEILKSLDSIADLVEPYIDWSEFKKLLFSPKPPTDKEAFLFFRVYCLSQWLKKYF